MFNSKIISNIDKNVALTMQGLDTLKADFDEHKHSDYKRREKLEEWEEKIIAQIENCPESEHIKCQNGKIDIMQSVLNRIEITASTKKDINNMIIKIVSIGIAMMGGLIAYLTYIR